MQQHEQATVEIKDGFGGYISFDNYKYTPVEQKGKESFIMGKPNLDIDSHTNSPLRMKNQFLNGSMQHPLELYHKHMETQIAPKIIKLLSKVANFSSQTCQLLKDACMNDPASVAIGLHYKPLNLSLENNDNVNINNNSDGDELQLVSFEEHYDPGTFALLSHEFDRCDKGILEIFYQNKWHVINPIKNCMFLVIGRTIEYWTNGYFKATLHRVRNITDEDRYSLAYFNNCNENVTFEMSLPIRIGNSNDGSEWIDDGDRLKNVKKKYKDMDWYHEKLKMSSVKVMSILMKIVPVPDHLILSKL